jgi:chloramphenicol-sensitive protein RarD
MSQNKAEFGQDLAFSFALFSAGLFTVVPLLLFNAATTRLPLTITGLLQYITPTIQFAIGVWINHEEMPTARWIGFVVIWLALATLGTDLFRSSRAIDNRIAQ